MHMITTDMMIASMMRLENTCPLIESVRDNTL
jgi:hypothetical protein